MTVNKRNRWQRASVVSGWLSIAAAFPLSIMVAWMISDAKGRAGNYLVLACSLAPSCLAIILGMVGRKRPGSSSQLGLVLGLGSLVLALALLIGFGFIMRNFRDI